MELHFVKNDLRFSSGKIFVSLENRNYETRIYNRHQSLINQRMETYLMDTVNTYLDTGCFLNWCRAYETVLGKSCKKLGVVLLYFSNTVISEDPPSPVSFTFLLQPSQKTFLLPCHLRFYYSHRKRPSSPHVIYFSATAIAENHPPPMSFTKTNKLHHEQKNVSFYILLLKQIILREIDKVRNCSFGLFAHSLLHISTQ